MNRQPKIGWALPRNFRYIRYHFYAGGRDCLCGAFLEAELFGERQNRRPIIQADARDCVAEWQRKFEPEQRIYQRP